MTEESKVRDVVDAVTGLAKAVPVYNDVAQPAAQEVGKALLTIAKTVHIALAPISVLVWGYEQMKDFVSTKVTERLKNVPPENIVTPKPNVAGPVLEALRYTGYEVSLSDLYANLLAASMDKMTAEKAHPAFAEIIRQLTPDEAKVVTLLLDWKLELPLLTVGRVRTIVSRIDSSRLVNEWEFELVNFSYVGEMANCEHVHLVPSYIDNICRLGLAEIPVHMSYSDPNTYERLKNASQVKTAVAKIESMEGWQAEFEMRAIKVTEFGKQFTSVCVARKDFAPDAV